MKTSNFLTLTFFGMFFLFLQACTKKPLNLSGAEESALSEELIHQPTIKEYVFNEKVRLYNETRENYVEYLVSSNDEEIFAIGVENFRNSTVTFDKSENLKLENTSSTNDLATLKDEVILLDDKESGLFLTEIYKSDPMLAYHVKPNIKSNSNGDRVYVNTPAFQVILTATCKSISVESAGLNNLHIFHSHYAGGWVLNRVGTSYWTPEAIVIIGSMGPTGTYLRQAIVQKSNGAWNSIFNYYITN